MNAYKKRNKFVLTHSGQICCYLNPLSPTIGTKKDSCSLIPAGNQVPHSCLPTPCSPRGDREEKWNKKLKLVGWDKDSSKGREKNPNNNRIYEEHEAQCPCSAPKTWCPAHSRAAIPVPQPTPPVIYWAWHHTVSNIPLASLGQLPWLCTLLASCEN